MNRPPECYVLDPYSLHEVDDVTRGRVVKLIFGLNGYFSTGVVDKTQAWVDRLNDELVYHVTTTQARAMLTCSEQGWWDIFEKVVAGKEKEVQA